MNSQPQQEALVLVSLQGQRRPLQDLLDEIEAPSRAEYEEAAGQAAALQAQIEQLRADTQRQIDELRTELLGETTGEATVDKPDEEEDYEDWTVQQLKAELEQRGLSTAGNKQELIERLREHDAA